MGCRHFRASWFICAGRYGNLFCNDIMFGCSMVMKEYSSLWMLSTGLMMCEFSRWKFVILCWSMGIGFGCSNIFLIGL